LVVALGPAQFGGSLVLLPLGVRSVGVGVARPGGSLVVVAPRRGSNVVLDRVLCPWLGVVVVAFLGLLGAFVWHLALALGASWAELVLAGFGPFVAGVRPWLLVRIGGPFWISLSSHNRTARLHCLTNTVHERTLALG
jgi:hypothetical protein